MRDSIENISSSDVVGSASVLAKAIAGGISLGLGVLFLLFQLVIPQEWVDVPFSLTILLGGVPLVIGLVLLVWAIFSMKKLRAQLIEKKTLRIAAKNNGVLTAGQLAISASISPHRADEILRNMQLRGIAEIDSNESGAICFKFYDLMA